MRAVITLLCLLLISCGPRQYTYKVIYQNNVIERVKSDRRLYLKGSGCLMDNWLKTHRCGVRSVTLDEGT